jgi:hypothetical protein
MQSKQTRRTIFYSYSQYNFAHKDNGDQKRARIYYMNDNVTLVEVLRFCMCDTILKDYDSIRLTRKIETHA